MESTLWERNNYLTDRKIISGSYITEYDISKANINILYAYNIISKELYDQLLRVDKQIRETYIGKQILREQGYGKIKNQSITYDTIKNGIMTAKKELFLANQLSDIEIVRIANDAVYVERPIALQYTSFDLNRNQRFITFNNKGTYTSYIQLNQVTIFFSYYNDNYQVEVKGISDDLLPLHESFLSFICDILYYMERVDKKTTILKFEEFYKQYIELKLPMSYYREFNNNSGYYIKGSRFITRFLDEKYFDKIDISYNNFLLRQIYSYILLSK